MSFAIWLTGIPGSGKTTIAMRLREMLSDMRISARILELDEIRKFLTPHPTYSEEEREIVYAALAYMAKLLVECGQPVIIDATANRRRFRERARSLIKRFAEVHVKCSLSTAMNREKVRKTRHSPAGIYRKALKEHATVPGVNVPYEEPLHPEVVVDTEKMSAEECAKMIADFVKEHLL